MPFADFQDSVAHDLAPPAGLGGALQALWHDGRGEWDRAHACVQADVGAEGAWVHAYLHRKEGDAGNARYWYSRAGRPVPTAAVTLGVEWEQIARELLRGAGA